MEAEEKIRKPVSLVWGALILGVLIVRMVIGFESVFGKIGGNPYVRYFEFFAAPGLILAALNLKPVSGILSWKGFVWIGFLSASLYYVHNNVMEDCLILNHVLNLNINFSSGLVFLLICVSIFPFALLWQYGAIWLGKWKESRQSES